MGTCILLFLGRPCCSISNKTNPGCFLTRSVSSTIAVQWCDTSRVTLCQWERAMVRFLHFPLNQFKCKAKLLMQLWEYWEFDTSKVLADSKADNKICEVETWSLSCVGKKSKPQVQMTHILMLNSMWKWRLLIQSPGCPLKSNIQLRKSEKPHRPRSSQSTMVAVHANSSKAVELVVCNCYVFVTQYK